MIALAAISRLRARAQWLNHRLGGRHWIPHVPLALLVGLGGLWLLRSELGATWRRYAATVVAGGAHIAPAALPPLLIGGGMLSMAVGLLFRSRVAWAMALLLTATAAITTAIGGSAHSPVLLAYFAFTVIALSVAWRQFDRSSVTASTLFALTSVAMLLLYATFGAYYLGAHFQPQITDLVTALYYAMVTMSTVGYGDIIPRTPEAKLFTVSVIVLGVAVFATSLTAVVAPMVSRSLQRIVSRRGIRMKRENHFVVIGQTSLAVNTWRELTNRGRPVTRLLREAPSEGEQEDVDVVVGDPSNVDTLRQAGVQKADTVLAMLADDSENAFVVLAVRELGGTARTVAAVNDAAHLSRIKLVQPDVVIAPQVLGAELIAMMLSGEQVTPDFVMQRVFQQDGGATAAPRGGPPGSPTA